MAELALAITPLCLGAVKAIRSVNKSLKTLKDSDSRIRRLRRAFKVQSGIFLDEFQLLFQDLLLDADLARELVRGADHTAWDDELERKIKIYLGERWDGFQATVSEIQGHIESLEQSLNTTTGDALRPDVNLKRSEHRREAAGMVLAGTSYESKIDGLRQCIQDIKSIRQATKEFNATNLRSFAKIEQIQQLPDSYQRVTQYSSSFYGALVSYWSCLQAHHTNHDVCLMVDKTRGDSSFRVAVHYQSQSGGEPQDGFLDLVVYSQNTDSLPMRPLQTGGDRKLQAVKRQVKFADAAPQSTTQDEENEDTVSTGSQRATTSSSANLCSCDDMCTKLYTQMVPTSPSTSRLNLDSPEHVRHYIRSVCGNSCDHKDCLNLASLRGPASLEDIFTLPLDRTISVPEQLRLALRLVNGVLQFQSTPWLQPLWGLQDLSYFQTDAGLAVALSTLHLSTELSRQRRPGVITVSDDILEAQLTHGIRNLTMHSLGVALLQIGRWDRLDPGDIVQIQRIADHESPLGPAYQSITQRCLECDFSHRCGKDLAKPELRNAIYRDVVCELEGLIYTLELAMKPVS